MVQGAPDWTNSVRLVAVDDEGNTYPVKVNAAGRLEAVIVGEGEDTLAALTVEDGRLICVIQDATTGEPVAIDTGGRMQVRLVAMVDEDTPHDVTLNAEGHLIVSLVAEGEQPLTVDDDGHLTCKLSGALASITDSVDVAQDAKDREMQGEKSDTTLKTIAVDDGGRIIGVLRDPTNDRYLAIDADGNIVAVMKGDYGGVLKTVAVDEDGRMETVVKGTKDVTRGLRLWYKFLPQEGTLINDSSLWGNNGISYRAAAESAYYFDGMVGPCIGLNGLDDYINAGHDTSLNLNVDISIEVWLKTVGNPVRAYLVSKYKSVATFEGFALAIGGSPADGTIQFYTDNLGAWAAGSIVNDDEWHHVIVTGTGATGVIYIDGEFNAAFTYVAATSYPTGDLTVGCMEGLGFPFPGYIDEVRVYGVALTPEEVTIRYNLTKPGTVQSLQAITVDARGAIEMQARDINAILRGVRVDEAGRMIGVIRDPTSDNYMKIDDEGFMQALMKGKYGAAFKTIATDEDGRMLSVIRNFPYEDRVLLRGAVGVTLGNTGIINLGGPAAGVIWVITNIYALSEGQTGFLGIEVYIHDGSNVFYIKGDGAADKSIYLIAGQCEIFLKNPDTLRVTFTDASATTATLFHASGYAVPVST